MSNQQILKENTHGRGEVRRSNKYFVEMKSPNTKHVVITHVVNPHQFYFKYTDDCINNEYSKFDYEIQLYGNALKAKKTHEKGYLAAHNELVIFFHTIFNKWIRGRVICVAQETILWCIDNG